MAKNEISVILQQQAKRIYEQGRVMNVRNDGPVFYAEVDSRGIHRTTITKNEQGEFVGWYCDCDTAMKGSVCEHVIAFDMYLDNKDNEVVSFKKLLSDCVMKYPRYTLNRSLVEETSYVLRNYRHKGSDMKKFFMFVEDFYEDSSRLEQSVINKIESVILDMLENFAMQRTDEFVKVSRDYYVSCPRLRLMFIVLYRDCGKAEHLPLFVKLVNDNRLKEKMPLIEFLLNWNVCDKGEVLKALKDYKNLDIYKLVEAKNEIMNGNAKKGIALIHAINPDRISKDYVRDAYELRMTCAQFDKDAAMYFDALTKLWENDDLDDLSEILETAKKVFPEVFEARKISFYQVFERQSGSRALASLVSELKDVDYIYDWIYGHLNIQIFDLVKDTLFEEDPIVFIDILMECCLNEYNKRRNIYGVHSFKFAMRDLEHKGYAKEQVFELCERLKSLSNPEYDLYHFCEEMEGELLDDIVRF